MRLRFTVYLLTKDGDKFNIALGSLGKYKNIHWEFQHEWRYILLLMPLNLNQAVDKSVQEFQTTSNKILCDQAKQAFPFYDLTLDENVYKQMEITLSPKISVGNRLIMNALIEKYNPSAIVVPPYCIPLDNRVYEWLVSQFQYNELHVYICTFRKLLFKCSIYE